jgi:hypothetical protein
MTVNCLPSNVGSRLGGADIKALKLSLLSVTTADCCYHPSKAGSSAEVLVSSAGPVASSNGAIDGSSYIGFSSGIANACVRPLRLGRSAIVSCIHLRMLYRQPF